MSQKTANEDRAAALQRLKLLKQRKKELITAQALDRERNRIYFFEPLKSTRRNFPYQSEMIEGFHQGKKIGVWTGPNKIGKTVVGACITVSWAMGFEPWHRLPDGGFRDSSLGIKPPISMRITGENWDNHLGRTVIPELLKWIPEGAVKTYKNNQGYDSIFEFVNGPGKGSVLELMTYSQDIKVFESWKGDAWWPDEPPSRELFTAMSRGLLYTGGKVFMSMTPLREAWVYDDLILSGRPDVFHNSDCNLWDNPQLYDHDMQVLLDCGLTEQEAIEFFNESIKNAWGNEDEEPPGYA